MKRFIYLLLLFLLVFLTSCENFMNGSSVQEQLSEMIDVANAKSFTIIVSQETTTGSFLSSGDKTCKLGYSIDVQYTVKKDAYIYKGLKAVSSSDNTQSRNDCVEFTAIDSDDARGIYKVSIKLVKESSDILIIPDCELVPNVEAENCLPTFESLGCEQDSPIVIEFNKPIETTENFTLSISDSSGGSLSSYFDEPYFSKDSKKLIIPTNKTTRLLTDNDTVSTKDIYVKIDLINIVDENGNTGSGVFQHKYRVNKQFDNVKPVLSSVKVYSTKDTTSEYYKEIVSKDFSNWTDTGDNFGDYGANHVGRQIYIELDGTDEGSGIAGIVVKEKLLKYTDQTSGTSPAVAHSDDCAQNLDTGKYYCNYTLNTTFDGILELEIFARDYANNISTESKKFWILKDTMIDIASIRFEEELKPLPSGNTERLTWWEENVPVINGDKQTITLTLNEKADSSGKKYGQDYYYGNYSSSFDISVFWSEQSDSITKPLTKNNNGKYTFERDVDQLVFIKIVSKDSIGNEKEIIKKMAPQPEMYEENMPGMFGISNMQTLLHQCGIDSDEQINTGLYCYCLMEFSNDSGDSFKYILTDTDNPVMNLTSIFSSVYPNGNYPEGDIKVYITNLAGDFASPISSNYYSTTITEWITAETYPGSGQTYLYPSYSTPVVSTNSTQGVTTVAAYGPEGTDYISREPLTITTTPVNNSGCYKVIIDDYMTQAGKDAGVIYTIYALAYIQKFGITGFTYQASSSVRTKTPEMYLTSRKGYKFYIEAYDSTAKKIYSPFSHSGIVEILPDDIQSFSLKINSSTETTEDLLLRDDLMAPIVTTGRPNMDYELDLPGGIQIELRDDFIDPFVEMTEEERNELEREIHTLPRNDNGNFEIDYYIIPSPSNNINYVPEYTITELKNDYALFKKTLEYNTTGNMHKVYIPYGDIPGGYYTISFVPKDIYGNTAVYTFPFVNTNLGKFDCSITGAYFDNTLHYYYFTLEIPEDKQDDLIVENNGTTQLCMRSSLDYYDNSSGMGAWLNISGEYFRFEDVFDERTQSTKKAVKIRTDETHQWRRLRVYNGFFNSDPITDGKGFYNYEYFFVGQDKTNTLKNCIDGLNGVQIFSNNSVFVHTLFSTDKLTESKNTKDAQTIWETKGVETGVQVYPYAIDFENSPYNERHNNVLNKTYDLSNLDEIPFGCYYTTIIHFADGSVIMTDIKQK